MITTELGQSSAALFKNEREAIEFLASQIVRIKIEMREPEAKNESNHRLF